MIVKKKNIYNIVLYDGGMLKSAGLKARSPGEKKKNPELSPLDRKFVRRSDVGIRDVMDRTRAPY